MNNKINHLAVWILVVVHQLIGRLQVTNAVAGLKVALLCWFAFLFVEYSTISAFSAFETNPWPLVFINMGRPLIAFALSGLVLGTWQRRVSAASGQ